MKTILALFLSVALMGCGVTEVIVKQASTDLTRTSELAKKYNKPEVAKCSDYLLSVLQSQDSVKAQLDALLAEPTDGILSASLKAALIAELGRNLASQDRAKFETDFKANCNAVAGDIMLNLLRDAATVAKRG